MKTIFRYVVALLLLAQCNTKPLLKLIEVHTLPDYPSASALSFYKDTLYVTGDDANFIYVTDSSFIRKAEIVLDTFSANRIPKPLKHDFESSSIFLQKNKPQLLLMGSGSLSPNRNSAAVIDIETSSVARFDMSHFLNRLRGSGIKEINIEGSSAIPAGFVLANRGNKGYPKNHLILTSANFWLNQSVAEIRVIPTAGGNDSSQFNGVSGLEYSFKSDKLLMTVSTENTYNAFSDGDIGKSYLWIINDLSSKTKRAAINPDVIIDLEDADKTFKGKKIESVCIVSETRQEMKLILAADDDKGTSELYTVLLKL